MDVEYEITLDDALALGYYHNAHASQARRTLTLFRILVILIFAALMAVALLSPEQSGKTAADRFNALLPVLIIGVAVISFFPAIQRWAVKRGVSNAFHRRQSNHLSSRFSLSVQPDGLIHRRGDGRKTGVGERITRWEDIRQIVVRPDHAFFYMDGATALIVPARALSDSDSWARFTDTARRYLDAAHSQS
jgi:hypothetical protein